MSQVLQIAEKTKVCKGCGSYKSLDQFHRHKATLDGLRPNCKDCRHKEYKAGRDHSEDLRQNVELIDGGRICLKCNQGKAWDQFAKDIHGYNKKTATCKPCRNEKWRKIYKENPNVRRGDIKSRPDRLKRHYGITYEYVVQTLANQFGLCANRACGREISLNVPLGRGRAVIDHNHTTGKFRALLCPECNTVLGTMETKQNLMLGLQEYLVKHKEN